MRRAVVLVLGGVLLLGACGDGEDGAVDTNAASTTDSAGEPIVIRTRVAIAAASGAETIATGEVVEGSTIGGSAFCVGGTILDTHFDPTEEPHGLIDRTITCPDGQEPRGEVPPPMAESRPADVRSRSVTGVTRPGSTPGRREAPEPQRYLDG